MSSTAGEPLRILRFWRDLEIFNIPTAPSARDSNDDQTKITTLRRGNVLPWCRTRFKPTDNLPFSQWSTAFADDQTLTAALLDRLLHHAHIVQIAGNSYRLRGKKAAGLVPVTNQQNNE